MSSYQFMFVSYWSILIPFLPGVYYFKRIDRIYHPFVFFIMAFTADVVLTTYLLTYHPEIESIHYNIYFLAESFLLFWMFKRWGLFKGLSKWFYFILLLYGTVWTLELFYVDFHFFMPRFIILYSFCTILMSLSMINKVIDSEEESIHLHPVFIIICVFLIFFLYAIVHAFFWMQEFNTSPDFRWKVFNLFNVINIICNIGYGVAILQMLKRQRLKQGNSF